MESWELWLSTPWHDVRSYEGDATMAIAIRAEVLSLGKFFSVYMHLFSKAVDRSLSFR